MQKQQLFLALALIAGGSAFGQNFTLSGSLKDFKPVDKVFINYYDGENNVRDSAELKNGNFSFTGKIAEPTVAGLQVRYQKQGDARAKTENLTFFLEPSTLAVKASDSLKGGVVTGSKGQKDFEYLKKAVDAYSPKLQPLYDEYRSDMAAGKKEDAKKVEKEIERIEAEMGEDVYGNFLKKNGSSPLAVYALQQYAGWDINPDKVEPLYASLPAKTKTLPSAVRMAERIELAKKTAVGRMAMDFTQDDTLGHAVSLSSFKGKYVLVDFWASWCGPCRAENPNVVKAFNQFKDRNFTILGVSLDRPTAKDRWMKAIHDDGLTWNHVSDLKYWDNAVAKQYGIRAIPQNLLIDPQGKIIAKNLSGEELASKLSEVLK